MNTYQNKTSQSTDQTKTKQNTKTKKHLLAKVN